jgi:hypothetical protein
MKKAYKYTVSELHHYLGQVCETDRQKRKYKVVQDLQFYCKLSESEAVTIWNEATEQDILTLYTTWETNEQFMTFSYDGVFVGDTGITDATDQGISRTAHNNKENDGKLHDRYGKDRKENKKRSKPQKTK